MMDNGSDAPRKNKIDTLSKFKAHWNGGTYDYRFTLGDYSRVLVHRNVATVLEAAPSIVNARCTACPIMHSSAWDCAAKGIATRKSRLPGHMVGYCPVYGTAVHHAAFVGDPTPTPHRRLYTVPISVKPY